MPDVVSLTSPQKELLADILLQVGTFRTKWAGWQERELLWMKWLHTGLATGRAISLGALFNATSTRDLEDKRSQFFSEWAWTRVKALHSRMISAPTNILPKVFGETEEDQRANERLMQFGVGIFGQLDDQKAEGFGGYSWDAAMKEQLGAYGKTAFWIRVSARGGVARVSAPFQNVRNLYHDLDVEPGERRRVVYEYTVPWSEVPALLIRFGGTQTINQSTKEDEENAVVVDYLVEHDGVVHRSIIVDGQPIRAEVLWRMENTTSIPMVIVSNPGGSHDTHDVRSGSNIVDPKVFFHAEPFYARAVPTLQFLEGLESLAADTAALSGLPIALHRRASSGQSEADPRELKPFGWIETIDDEQLSILQNVASGALPLDAAIERILRYLQSFFPDFLVSPDFPTTASGFSVNSQAISLASVFMQTWTRMAERAKKMLLKQVFLQHSVMASPFELHGILPEGGPFATQFRSSDYGDKFFDIDVLEPAEIPGQALQNMNLAVTAVQNDLSSHQLAMTTRLGINDARLEQDRMIDEKTRFDQESINRHKLIQRREEVQSLFAEADRENDPVRKATKRLEATLAQVELANLERQLLGAPNTGFQQNPQTGTPPEANPPQNTVNNPQDQALAQGVPSTGTQGRPRPEGQA